MKTTVELPDGLFREIKLKSVAEGRKLKETMTELLRAGLAASNASLQAPTPPKTAPFPIVKCRHRARPENEMTPERVAGILQAQDVAWHEKSGR